MSGGRLADVARQTVPVDEAMAVASEILFRAGCPSDVAAAVAAHLADADLCGVASHGLTRLTQYVAQFESGYMRADGRPTRAEGPAGTLCIDGGGGIGIPAMALAVEQACTAARASGIAALALRNCGHTGRLGAFAEAGAAERCLVLIVGGGGRERWRQVAPFGGRKAVLPTNPWAVGIPGGARGPVVLDFATGVIAGGWIHAARAAGALLPEGAVIDPEGRPTRDPADYARGGAILPFGGAKGYALGVIAELIGDAMLGPVTAEMNWLVIALDTARWRDEQGRAAAAEAALAELRGCPPAAGFAGVEIPGERERDLREAARSAGVALPARTWEAILALRDRLRSPGRCGGGA